MSKQCLGEDGSTEILRDFRFPMRKASVSQLGHLPLKLHCFPFVFEETPRGPTLQFSTLICEQCVPFTLTPVDQKLCGGRKEKKKTSWFFFPAESGDVHWQRGKRPGGFTTGVFARLE